MIIWSSIKQYPHTHCYLFILAITKIHVKFSIKPIEKLSRRHFISSFDDNIKEIIFPDSFSSLTISKLFVLPFVHGLFR